MNISENLSEIHFSIEHSFGQDTEDILVITLLNKYFQPVTYQRGALKDRNITKMFLNGKYRS